MRAAQMTAGLAFALWAIVFVVILWLHHHGSIAGVSYTVYADAGSRWLARSNLYELTNIEGFQYFPVSAMLFAPFTLLGAAVGGVVWRAVGWGLLAWAVWRLAGELRPEAKTKTFLAVSVLTVPIALGSLGNGQANLLLAALTLHAVVELGRRSFGRASLWLGLGVCIKPHLAVLALVVWALYRPMRWRLTLVIMLGFTLPWWVAGPEYAGQQHLDFLAKLRAGTAPPAHYEDIRGLLATLGWVVPHRIATGIRLVGAMGAWWLGYRARSRPPMLRALIVAGVGAAYLMLFSPRTQSTTYVLVAMPAAFLMVESFFRRRYRTSATLLGLLVAWTVNYRWLPQIELWLKPLAAVLFVAVLISELAEQPEDQDPHRLEPHSAARHKKGPETS